MIPDLKQLIILTKISKSAEFVMFNNQPVVVACGVPMPYYVFVSRLLNYINPTNPQINDYLNKAYTEINDLWSHHDPLTKMGRNLVTEIINESIDGMISNLLQSEHPKLSLRELIINLEQSYETQSQFISK